MSGHRWRFYMLRRHDAQSSMPRLRNVVLAGHADSGKTTLAEHLLCTAGAINRLGKVDDGTAMLDFEPEEQKRKQSLSLAVATFDHNEHGSPSSTRPATPTSWARWSRASPRPTPR